MSVQEKERVISQVVMPLWQKFTLQNANSAADFFESGGDSLAAINLIVEVNKAFNLDISLEKFMRSPTLSFLLETICNG